MRAGRNRRMRPSMPMVAPVIDLTGFVPARVMEELERIVHRQVVLLNLKSEIRQLQRLEATGAARIVDLTTRGARA